MNASRVSDPIQVANTPLSYLMSMLMRVIMLIPVSATITNFIFVPLFFGLITIVLPYSRSIPSKLLLVVLLACTSLALPS